MKNAILMGVIAVLVGLVFYRSFQSDQESQSSARSSLKVFEESMTKVSAGMTKGPTLSFNNQINGQLAGDATDNRATETTNKSPNSSANLAAEDSSNKQISTGDETLVTNATMHATKLKELLNARLNTTVEMVPESWHRTYVGEDGASQAEYQSSDGATVRQWYDTKGELQIEEFDYGPNGKLTKWREWGPDKDVVVQLDVGQQGVQTRYHSNLQPKSEQTWDEEHESFTEL